MTSASGAPDLAIDLWDDSGIGVAPDLPEASDAEEPYCFVSVAGDGRHVLERRNHSTLGLDRAANRLIGCITSFGMLFVDERARPLQRMIAAWLARSRRSAHPCRAGERGADDGALVVGMSGAGKSTTSLACLTGGFGFLGDDFVGIHRTPSGSYDGHGLYASGLLEAGHLRRFPELEPSTEPAFHDIEVKSLVYLHPRYADRLRVFCKIRALAVPRLGDTPQSAVHPAPKGKALLALAPTSVMFMPGNPSAAMAVLADLVRALPTYWLEVGRDPTTIPAAVGEVLSRARSDGA